MNQTVSVIIRTMVGREKFLDKCLFILSGQSHTDIEPIVVAQLKQNDENLESLKNIVAKWKKYFPKIQFIYHVAKHDARAHSLNMGKDVASGRYIAFLDDDDKVYPAHYKKLITALQNSQFAWAYSDIVRADFNADNQLISRTFPFERPHYSFAHHLIGNYIPIHAFVIDTERATDLEKVNEQLSKLEDYDFLLRLAFKHQPLYLKGATAEYCIRSDGSNTVLSNSKLNNIEQAKKQQEWDNAEKEVDKLKLLQFGWWVEEIQALVKDSHTPFASKVQTNNNIESDAMPNLAIIQSNLEKIYHSHTWKIIRAGKKINWKLRGKPKKPNKVPNDPRLMQKELAKIMSSPAWLLLSPLYCIEVLVKKWKK